MIDEKKLLKDLEKEIEFAKKCNMPQMVAGMNQIKSIIENQPKVMEWIPCSDRPPEDMQYVNVTTDDGVVTEAFYSERKKMFIKSAGPTLKVKAWMDKPEPYREDECGKRVK